MNKLLKLIVILAIVSSAVVLGNMTHEHDCTLYHFGGSAINSVIDTVQQQRANSQTETLCIRELVSTGVERIDIKTVHGECFIETNGYYK